MRLPYPERIPLFHACVFCGVLCLIQQLQGTTALFSLGTISFILLTTLAFNTAGGLTRPSGAFIFMYSTIAVIFGIVYKSVVGEPAQSNLLQPDLTIVLYVGTMVSMLAAAYMARRFRRKVSYLPKFASDEEMYRGSLGCLVAGTVLFMIFAVRKTAPESGSILSALLQLDVFLPLSVLLGVTYVIRTSGGKRSVNATVCFTIFILFIEGVLTYSKQGMLSPFICWLIPAAAQRYKISLVQIAGFGVAFFLTLYYLVPYSQYGRNFKSADLSFSDNLKTNLLLLSNLDLVRKVYLDSIVDVYTGSTYHYYNKPEGIADRAQMITPDDAIIDATEHGAVFGVAPTIYAFQNLVPHFLWPGKIGVSWGNTYAHELGLVSDDDITTGISFSPTGDAYHQAKWVGIFVFIPVLSFMMFIIVDSICGDTRASPFSLLTLIAYSHLAPEGGILQFVYESFTNMGQIFFAAIVGVYVLPFAAKLFLGAVRKQGVPVPIRAVPGRRPAPDTPSIVVE